MRIFVTVGMSRWPFDRLLEAVLPLCAEHTLVVQTGHSKVHLPCRTSPFLPFEEVIRHMRTADVIITHAGNTVRLAQRMGKVPIAMARQARFREMANGHQVYYLRQESEHGRVVPLWDPGLLPELVNRHLETQAALLASRPLPPAASGDDVAELLDRLCRKWIEPAGRRTKDVESCHDTLE